MNKNHLPDRIIQELEDLGFSLPSLFELEYEGHDEHLFEIVLLSTREAELREIAGIVVKIKNPRDEQNASIASIMAVIGRVNQHDNKVTFSSQFTYNASWDVLPSREQVIEQAKHILSASKIYSKMTEQDQSTNGRNLKMK